MSVDFGGEGRDINTTTARWRVGRGGGGKENGRGRERERRREEQQELMNHIRHSPRTHVYNIATLDLTSYVSNFTSHAYQRLLSADVSFDSCSHRSPVEPSVQMRNDTCSVIN